MLKKKRVDDGVWVRDKDKEDILNRSINYFMIT